jgi:flagellar protein FliO/FliZ
LHVTPLHLARVVVFLLIAPLPGLLAQGVKPPPAAEQRAAGEAGRKAEPAAQGSAGEEGPAVVSEESLVLPGEPEGAAAAAPAGPLVSTWDFLRMLLILAAVVGVIYLLFHLLKRGFRRQLPQNDLIRVLGSRSLSGNRALHLVAMGRSIFLVGAAESGISLIAEIKDQETLDQIRLESSQGIAPQGFAQFFQSLWKGGGKRNLTGDSLEFMKQQRQRLQKM